MDFPDPWIEAWRWAWPAWQTHLRHAGWHPLATAAAEGGAALLCLAAARVAPRTGVAAAGWHAAATLSSLLALNTLFALDLLAIELARSVARAGGWYEARRSVQAAALAALAAAAVALSVVALARRPAAAQASRHHPDAAARHGAAATLPKALLTAGLALLAAVAVLRAVSLHATDLWLATRLAGVSRGRLVDALGLLLVVAPALATLRRAAR